MLNISCCIFHQQMYGFVEEYPNNIYDTVDIELGLLYTTAEKVMPSIEEKRKWMTAEGIE